MGFDRKSLGAFVTIICTITLSWSKCSYKGLPFVTTAFPDIVQSKKSHLVGVIEYITVYLENLLVTTEDLLKTI